MPAALTIVMPTLNAAAALPRTADALLEGVADGLVAELVISDGGSEDQTAEMAGELGARLVTGPAGRGGQIARGVAAASTEWVLILHADTHLSPGWPAAVRRHMATHPDAAAWFRLAFRGGGLPGRVVAAGATLRSRLFGMPYGDQGLLVSKSLLAEIGGVPELPLMEDVALARRLKGRLRPLGASAATSAERYLSEGWTRRVARNLVLLARFSLGASPERLARDYRRR